MPSLKNAFFILTLAACSTDVTSWIVDMAEVERSLGADQSQQRSGRGEKSNASSEASEGDNEITYTTNYAEKFEYGTLRKKEVDSVIKHGGDYLEGLSGALAAYRAELESCRRNSSKELKSCETMEQKKRVVQKLSRLALSTTDKLRDISFENTDKEGEAEEKTALVQLAWSLEQLAALTGYGAARDARSRTPDTSKSPKLPQPISNVPAVLLEQKDLEILEQVENGRPLPRLPPKPDLTAVKSVQKRDTSDALKYYVKYKVWNGSNSMNDQRNSSDRSMEVANSVRSLAKRSVPDKKFAYMRGVLAKHIKCNNVKAQTKNTPKLVKFVKVFRRKVFKKSSQ